MNQPTGDEQWLLDKLRAANTDSDWVPIDTLEGKWLSNKTEDLGDFAEVLFSLAKQGLVRIDNTSSPIKIYLTDK